jgi:succinyl-CoA synthetase alpha subunit
MCAKDGRVMGHAGAWQAPGEGSATDKWNALESAGCVMVDHPAKFGNVMKQLLEKPNGLKASVSSQDYQRQISDKHRH